MSKKSYLKIAFVIAVLSSISAFNSNDSYAASAAITGATVINQSTFSPSNKVTVAVITGYKADGATAAVACTDTAGTTTPCNAFAAKTKHATGTRVIGSKNTDSKIYYSTTATQIDAVVVDEVYTAWTAM